MTHLPRNCYHMVCQKCRQFGPRAGGRYIKGKGFICNKCAQRKAA